MSWFSRALLRGSATSELKGARSHFGHTYASGLIMRQISLREFRTRGSKALEALRGGETVLLSGEQGPAYFLVPVLGDVAMEEGELRRAMAKVSLHESWLQARESGLDQINAEAIEKEIGQVRRAPKEACDGVAVLSPADYLTHLRKSAKP